MARSPSTLPRKLPRQARAQATVNAILDATVQILDREGLDAATTTRIAEVAGVSVGSLYQYFPHRDAVLNGLQEREFERALDLMRSVLTSTNLARNPRETLTAVMQGLARLYGASPGLHRVLAIEGLRVAKADRVHAFDARVLDLIVCFLGDTAAPIRRRNVEAAAFVAFQSVRATMLANLLSEQPGLAEAVLVEELVDLVLRYLVASEPGSGFAARSLVAGRRSGRYR